MMEDEKDAKVLRQALLVKKQRTRNVLVATVSLVIFFWCRKLLTKSASLTTTVQLHQGPHRGDDIGSNLASSLPKDSIYRLAVDDQFGSKSSLSRFVGKATLIVNTACQSDKTQITFKQLSKLHEELAPYGFSVIAFPMNDFGHELPDNESIFVFLQNTFPEITFPIMGLSSLKQNPVYQQLQKQLPDMVLDNNFYKILVDRHGRGIKAYSKDQLPMAIISDVRSSVVNFPRN